MWNVDPKMLQSTEPVETVEETDDQKVLRQFWNGVQYVLVICVGIVSAVFYFLFKMLTMAFDVEEK